jgi:N-acetylglutamate synthase-like GNAT family acetyltransferase
VIRINATGDYRPLIPFFIENDLEFEEGEEYEGDEIVRCWRADASGESENDSHLVGACVLARRGGEFICDGIAVDSAYRKDNLGRTLLDLLLKEAKDRGADRVFLVARAPGFFAKAGFVPVPREDAPEFFECFTCPQYGKTCHPEVMRLNMI